MIKNAGDRKPKKKERKPDDHQPPAGGPEKVAILGGGVGALVTAFELTSQEGWRDRYDVTVYQVGWRLGGKGASGRNRKRAHRIEEHGLHLWFGFYHNAFWVLRRCYQELGRKSGTPLCTLDQAFAPYPYLGVMEQEPAEPPQIGEWLKFIEEWETDDEKPGTTLTGVHSNPWEIVNQLVTLAQHAFSITPPGQPSPAPPFGHDSRLGAGSINEGAHPSRLRQAAEHLAAAALFTAGLVARNLPGIRLPAAAAVPQPPPPRFDKVAADDLDGARSLADTLDVARDLFWDQIRHVVEDNTFLRRSWVLFDLAVSIIRGMVHDGVLRQGWKAVDHFDFRDWLARWGANRLTVNHGMVIGCYDFVFAYVDGQQKRKSVAAGAMARFMAGMMLDYQGSLAWAMQAGMGDTVFAPLYEVLKRRGVKFQFFHRVKSLHLDPTGQFIQSIDMERQVDLVAPGEYQPLYVVKGLPCWPSEPLFEQIQNGAQLEAGWDDKAYNLESAWSRWPAAAANLTLTCGQEFHRVVLGIGLGALPDICQELIAHNPLWRAMVDKVLTVPTMAMQLWLRPDLASLGWPGAPAVVDAYEWPLSTYADLSHLIAREDWPDSPDSPGSLAYFCGALGNAQPPAQDPHLFPEQQLQEVKRQSERWLEQHPTVFWPAAADSNRPSQLNYELLVDDPGHRGRQRLDAQYFRANVNPSDRYVMTTPGSTRHRLHPSASGYRNLILAGDWTDNPLNTGCVEAATMSGMLASRAICGEPHLIAGEVDQPMLRRQLSAIEVEGEYEASIAALALPKAQVLALLPKDFRLQDHSGWPGSNDRLYPVLVACGERFDARLTIPRLPPLPPFAPVPRFPPQTYKEVMIAIPFVIPKQACACGRSGPFLYVPKFYVGNVPMALGGKWLWQMDIEQADIWQEIRSGRKGDSWGVKDSRSTQETYLTLASHTTDGAFRPLRQMNGSFAQVQTMLDQPLAYSPGQDPARTVCADLAWNLDQAMVRPARMDLRFAVGFLQGRLKGWHSTEALSEHQAGSFVLRRQPWRLSLPHRCRLSLFS